MAGKIGGYRPGAGRPKGSRNKTTIAKEAVAEILDLDDADQLQSAVHKRGHQLLIELERIALDPTQPVAARIMAAKSALPFLLPKQVEPSGSVDRFAGDALVQRLIEGRRRNASFM
jgi:hypothetical protein